VGDIILPAFGLLALVALTLIGLGAYRRSRLMLVLGAALIFALVGMWVIGLPGAAFGLIPLAFWRRRPSAASLGRN
jgi:hypothetical protein